MAKGTTTLILVSIGLVLFFLVASLGDFKDGVFRSIFPRSQSRASLEDKTPIVSLNILYQENIVNNPYNISKYDGGITLMWSTQNNPAECLGRSYGLVDKDETWEGLKSVKGGVFIVKPLVSNNPYVYVLECKNEFGDSSGAAVTINVNPQQNNISPYFTNFEIYDTDQTLLESPIATKQFEKLVVNWGTINTGTPYSICISTGSFPKEYHDIRNIQSIDTLEIKSPITQKFNIYCSNESGFTTKGVTIFVR